MPRNPAWGRDELILLLDLFLRTGRRPLRADHPDVIGLSRTLGGLPVHPPHVRTPAFRNENGVSMKLANLCRLDPRYSGAGLGRGNRLEKIMWEEFASDPVRLRQVADAIRRGAEGLSAGSQGFGFADENDEEFFEGKLLTRLHRLRDRSAAAVRRKKREVLAHHGRLACEVCGFDFRSTYGELGEGYAECHHRVPVAELRPGDRTCLADLAIVCANCHHMLHRSRPMLMVEELRAQLENTRTSPTCLT